MSLRGLASYGKSSDQAAKIAKAIIDKYGGDEAAADELFQKYVLKCLWTKEIWGDMEAAENAAAGLILAALLTKAELEAAGIHFP